jgi:hypothetical protein
VASYSDLVLADLPASGSYWKYPEDAGTLVDSGGGAHNGTVVGTPVYGQAGIPAGDDPNRSLLFAQATNQGVDAGDVFEFTGTQSFSVEIWVKPKPGAAALNPFLIGQVVANSEGWEVRYLASGLVRVSRWQAAAADQLSSAAALSVETWNHIVVTYDGTNSRIYLNGKLTAGPTASAKSIQANAATLIVGKYSGTGNSFDGWSARPAVYPSVVLTADQVAAHFIAGNQVPLNPNPLLQMLRRRGQLRALALQLIRPKQAVVAGGPFTYDEFGSLVTGAVLAGDDVAEYADTGALTTAGLASGTDVAEHAEAAALIAGTFGSAADVYTAAESGALVASGLLAGVEQKIGGGETGSIMASGLVSGADAAQHDETGALTTGAQLSGADALAAAETGAVIAGALLSGTDAAIHAELGSLIAGALLAGVDAVIASETGSITTQGLLSGVQVKVGAGKAGSIATGGLASGADAAEHAELGALVAGTFGSAADAHIAAETGSLIAGALLQGSDVYIATETGSLVASPQLSGETDTALPVVVFFDQPSPGSGVGPGSPTAAGFDAGTPSSGTDPGSPDATPFDAPRPRRVLT